MADKPLHELTLKEYVQLVPEHARARQEYEGLIENLGVLTEEVESNEQRFKRRLFVRLYSGRKYAGRDASFIWELAQHAWREKPGDC